MDFSMVIGYLPMFVAPIVLALFSFVTAYVFKFGLPKTGINQDYILFTIYIVVACLIGGVL